MNKKERLEKIRRFVTDGHGNIEFLAYLRKEDHPINQVTSEIEKIVEKAHREFKDE